MPHSRALARQLAVIVALSCTSALALAAPSPPASGAATTTAPRFAVGAGLSWPGESFGTSSNALAGVAGGAGGLSGLGGLTSSLPAAVLSGEVRVGRTYWLMTALSAGYASGESGAPDDFSGTKSTVSLVKTSATQLAATIGVRHVHNPDSRVEVSGYAAVSLRRSASTSDVTPQPDASGATSTTVTARTRMEVGGALGLTFDTQLNDAIWLRFATPLIYGATTSLQQRTTGDAGADAGDLDGRDTGFGLRFAPTLTLRMVF